MTTDDGARPMRVLIVEDDEALRNLILKALRKAGYEADGVATGAEALERVKTDPGLALLLDQKLPDMTGRDIIKALNERGLRVPCPFIVMTGQGDERLAVEMMKLGAVDYLVKNLDFIDLLPGAFQRLFRDLENERLLGAAEASLRESEERHRTILQTAMDGFVLVTMQGRLLEVNNAWCKMSGYSEQELLTMRIQDLTADGSDEKVAATIENIMTTGGEALFEDLIRRKDGSIFDVEVSAQYNPVEGGRLVVFLRDITRRKQKEAHDRLVQAVEERAKQLRQETEAPPTDGIDTVLLVDDESSVLSALTRSLRNTGYELLTAGSGSEALSIMETTKIKVIVSDEQMVGMKGSELLAEVQRRFPHTLRILLTGHATLDAATRAVNDGGIYRFLTKPWDDGMLRLALFAATEKYDSDAEKRRLAEELRKSHDLLEQRVEERTKQLQESLSHAEELTIQAEAANRAKSLFIGNMSHELRTPLSGVLGMTDLLLNTPVTDKQRSYAETIRKSGRALLAVVSDILDFSKISAGNMALSNAPFFVEAVIANVVNLFSSPAAEEKIGLHAAVDPELPALRGDAHRLTQVINNLVGNAVKFTKKGEIQVTVKILRRTEAEVDLAIGVQDTGIGMTEEELSRIFTGFTQGDTTTARRFGGTGLGLTISRNLVELMGGTLQVESVFGKGSLFTVLVTFPIAPGAEKYTGPDLKSLSASSPSPARTATPAKPAGPPGDMAELQTLLEQLKRPMENAEPRPCKEILAILLAKSWPEEQETLLAELNRLVNRYRLQEALDLLNKR